MSGDNSKFAGNEQQRDVRSSNIVAAKAVSNCIRTSLGPKGMDKMIQTASGEVTITNDGATILGKMEVQHPAAKMLMDLSAAQDVEAGDGTTSVVVICGALLSAAERLLTRGLHPSVISESWQQAAAEAVKILSSEKVAIPIDLTDRKNLIKTASTSLNSKVIGGYSDVLAPLAVDAVLGVCENIKTATSVDLSDIKVVKKMHGTLEDTELILDGLVLDRGCVKAAGGPTKMEDCKIGLIQFCLSAPKTDMENSVIVRDSAQIDRIFREERRYILKMIKKIVKSGCNVLLVQKSILRDATSELAQHYLAKKKIMLVTDIERKDIEFITKSLGCQPIAHIDAFAPEMLGNAKSVVEDASGGGKIIRISGVKNPGKAATILLNASNRLVLDEAERSLHDALCVVRCLVKMRYLTAGGAANEAELTYQLGKKAKTMGGVVGYCTKAFAEALEVIPYTLAENAGLHPIKIVTKLRKEHSEGNSTAGINIKKGTISNMVEENVLQPLLVSVSAIKLATETVQAILKIDDIVPVR
uniref:T-complex protein 1 subunit delta n=1 Tax=Lotharella globosa TaxID=91324 RepID=A0A6V3IM85_9EUKA|mmetsp:Transcript_8725/g.16970  ORF Transcript_8725/g.16970 Transcript_8725/m.16970 type:complete len:529 (+) Transcript_8725:61-1647(+)